MLYGAIFHCNLCRNGNWSHCKILLQATVGMSTPAALHGIECACYTGQSLCNLCCNGVARQVAKEIAPCNTTFKERAYDIDPNVKQE